MATNNNPGRTGLNQSRGIIFEEFLPELRGRQWYKKADEMRKNCAVIAGALLAMEMPLRDIDFYWESDEGEDDPRLELLEAAEKNLSHTLFEHVSEALTMLWAGYSTFAIWYERVDGQMLWRKFLPLGQDTVYRWDIDDEGGINGLWQYPHIYPERIPIERLILYRTKTERNNPEGWSLLRPAYPSYYYWKNLSQIEGIGLERGLAGLPVIHLPQGADTTESTSESSDYGRASVIVRNVRQDEQAGVVLPYGWELDLLSTSSSLGNDTDKVINRYESRMMIAMMTQFLMLGQASVGTQALSSDQTDWYTQSINALADIISDTFTRHLIPKLMVLNGQDPDGLRLAHSPAGDLDLSTIADFLQKVGTNFITWTPQDETWLRSLARLPEIDEEELATLQEEKQAQKMEEMQQITEIQGKNVPPNGDKSPAKFDWDTVLTEYASQGAPDDKTRRSMERQMKRELATFFTGQQKRINKAVRSLRG